MVLCDEKLLELVEQYDVIYNRHHPLYKYVDKKEDAFAEIAAKMGVADPKLVILRYRTLRDRFVRYKRIQMTTGKVKYYLPVLDKMEFLTPHVFYKKRGAIDRSNNNAGVTCKSDESNSFDPLQVSLSSLLDETEETTQMTFCLPAHSPEPTSRLKSFKRKSELPPIEVENHTKMSKMDEAFSEAVECLQRACKSREDLQKNDALYGFRQMILATIAGMSETKQAKAMLLVTEAVMQIKMEDDEYKVFPISR